MQEGKIKKERKNTQENIKERRDPIHTSREGKRSAQYTMKSSTVGQKHPQFTRMLWQYSLNARINKPDSIL